MSEQMTPTSAAHKQHQKMWLAAIALIIGISAGYIFVLTQTPDAFGSAYECTIEGGPNHPVE